MEKRKISLPTPAQIQSERRRLRRRAEYGRALGGTVNVLAMVAAFSMLISFLFLPVIQIAGESMAPTLREKDVVALVKTGNLKTGDLAAFHFNNKILIKRVIAGPGDWVTMDGEGNVFVNGLRLEEPYIQDKSLGECDRSFPLQVGADAYFVLGDHRETSIDSRSALIGEVHREQIVGKLRLIVYPLDRLGWIGN